MIEQHLDIATADGAMNSFVVHPEEGGPFPVLLFYMDAPGKREELHDMARRLAAVGYCVLLPNLYYRRSRDFTLAERTEPAMAEMFTLMNTLDAATTRCDTRTLLDFADALPQADATRIGAVGYCMSGPFVMWAAAAFPERLACIASIHGANMATDKADSPHRMAPAIRCEATSPAPSSTSGRHRRTSRPCRRRCRRQARRIASSGFQGWNTASSSRSVPASTTAPPPSGTGSGCSACSTDDCGAQPADGMPGSDDCGRVRGPRTAPCCRADTLVRPTLAGERLLFAGITASPPTRQVTGLRAANAACARVATSALPPAFAVCGGRVDLGSRSGLLAPILIT
jgi:carboxymethylenebutenolidase